MDDATLRLLLLPLGLMIYMLMVRALADVIGYWLKRWPRLHRFLFRVRW